MADIYQRSLEYHRLPKPGKLEVCPTKPLADQQDLALAYSPGVAAASRLIKEEPGQASSLTARGNLIAVVSNGTAVLGLGNIGALASKPVMEGKAVLFKKFAGIDVFDIEVNEENVDKLVDVIAALEPTFGGINLEDIKAPECFLVEKKLKERLKIPVFHDDQHGTAIIVAAAVINGLELVNKNIENVKLVCSGAGAAAIACLDLLVAMGLRKENVIIADRTGVVYQGRAEQMDENKNRYAADTKTRQIAEAMDNADIFLGVSAAGVISKDMVKSMAANPLVLALANPDPEITPEDVMEVRSDAIIATGRSDYPNQVNNVLCFPYIFRGALDVGATTINQEMKIACVRALAKLAQAEGSEVVSSAYGGDIHRFGPNYIIPKPFDPRLIVELSSAVAKAAMDTGVATRPIDDLSKYRDQLDDFVYRSSMVMRQIFSSARKEPKRVTFAEGENYRVLRSVQTIVDEGIAKPILIGRPAVIEGRLAKLGLRLKSNKDFEIIDPNQDERYNHYWQSYHQLMERNGVSPDVAKMLVRTNNTIIGALTVHLNDSDALICGTIGRYMKHYDLAWGVLGHHDPSLPAASLHCLVQDRGPLFITDTYVNNDPNPEELAKITLMAAKQVRKFGIIPKVALVSSSNFGSGTNNNNARKMRIVLGMVKSMAPDLEIEGEMNADAALVPEIREAVFPNSKLSGCANLLIMPCLDSANIAYNMSRIVGNIMTIGPILMGASKPLHILTPSVQARGIVNMTALAVVDAIEQEEARAAA